MIGMKITEDFSHVNPGENTEVYILLEHTSDREFLIQLAHKLLDYPCRDFNFYGEYGYLGEVTFDRVDTERGYTDETVALTCCYHDLERLAKRLYAGVKIERHDVLILYDDPHLHNQFLRAVRKKFPWYLRRKVPKEVKQLPCTPYKNKHLFSVIFFSAGAQPVSGVIAAVFYKRYLRHRFVYSHRGRY